MVLLTVPVCFTLHSVSLMTCIGCLSNIAKQRPSYISTVVQTFELLHGACMYMYVVLNLTVSILCVY